MLAMHGVQDRSLVRELRSHMPWGTVKKIGGEKGQGKSLLCNLPGSESGQERLSVLPVPTALLSVHLLECVKRPIC